MITGGRRKVCVPLKAATSLAQIPAAFTRTRTSPGPGVGTGTSTISAFPASGNFIAFMKRSFAVPRRIPALTARLPARAAPP